MLVEQNSWIPFKCFRLSYIVPIGPTSVMSKARLAGEHNSARYNSCKHAFLSPLSKAYISSTYGASDYKINLPYWTRNCSASMSSFGNTVKFLEVFVYISRQINKEILLFSRSFFPQECLKICISVIFRSYPVLS